MSVRKDLVLIATCMALVAASRVVFAADGATHPCANLPDNKARLACYDQAFGKPPEPMAVAPVAVVPVAPEAHFGFKEMEVRRQADRQSSR